MGGSNREGEGREEQGREYVYYIFIFIYEGHLNEINKKKGQTKPQLDISHHQIKLPVLGMSYI